MPSSSNPEDSRWDNRVPWYLRYSGLTVGGGVDLWLDLIGQRLETMFNFNELGISNEMHFGARLQTETLGRFQYAWGPNLGSQLKAYFAPSAVRQQAELDTLGDPEELRAVELRRKQRRGPSGAPMSTPPLDSESLRADIEARSTKEARTKRHWHARLSERIATLEAVMRLASDYASTSAGLAAFVTDVRRLCAAAHVPLDVRESPPLIYPLEEPLLQREVVDPLLSRLAARWPERARELVTAYHDVLAGAPLDEVFSNAFKTVEEIARSITGDQTFDFSDSSLNRHFPLLHPTIRSGIAKLRAHRGDAAAHGRKAPQQAEIRFLLFQLCNLALLVLDTDRCD